MHALTERANGFVEMAYAGDTPWRSDWDLSDALEAASADLG